MASSIFYSTDYIQEYHYVTKAIDLHVKGQKPVSLSPRRLVGFSIEDDYEENIHPLFKVQLVMSDNLYYYILAHKNDCTLHLRIESYYITNKQTNDRMDKTYKAYQSAYRKFIDETFDIIEDADDADMNRALKKSEAKSNFKKIIKEDEEFFKKNSQNKIEFYLFKNVDGGRRIVGEVLKNANITDAIAYLMTVAGRNDVYMTQPDNVKVYRQLLIPHTSVIKALRFLDTYYGIYRKGSMIWFGFKYTWILPYEAPCSVWRRREIKNVSLMIPKGVGSIFSNKFGMMKRVKDNSHIYVVGNGKTMGITNDSIANDYIKGNDIKVVDSYSGLVKTGKSKAKSKNNTNHYKVVINHTENRYIDSMYISQTQAKSTVVKIRLANIDANAFTPNKCYSLIFEDSEYRKKYSGRYIIAGITHTFTSEGDGFVVNSVAMFRKDYNGKKVLIPRSEVKAQTTTSSVVESETKYYTTIDTDDGTDSGVS